MTAGSGGSPASPRLFARHRFPFRISLSRRDAPGLARGSWSFLCPLPTVNTRVRRPCSDLTAASSLPRASFPVPAAPRDAEPPSVVRAFVSGSCSLGSCPVRGPHTPRCVGFQASHLPASGLLPPSLAVPTSSVGSVPNSALSGKPAQLPGHVPGPGAGFSFR